MERYGISAPDPGNKNASATVEEVSLFYSRIKYIDGAGNATEFTVASISTHLGYRIAYKNQESYCWSSTNHKGIRS